jgi:hypothetical protein
MDVANFDLGFAEILRLVHEMHTPYIDPFDVRLVGSDDPLAKAAVDMNRNNRFAVAQRLVSGKSVMKSNLG